MKKRSSSLRKSFFMMPRRGQWWRSHWSRGELGTPLWWKNRHLIGCCREPNIRGEGSQGLWGAGDIFVRGSRPRSPVVRFVWLDRVSSRSNDAILCGCRLNCAVLEERPCIFSALCEPEVCLNCVELAFVSVLSCYVKLLCYCFRSFFCHVCVLTVWSIIWSLSCFDNVLRTFDYVENICTTSGETRFYMLDIITHGAFNFYVILKVFEDALNKIYIEVCELDAKTTLGKMTPVSQPNQVPPFITKYSSALQDITNVLR